MKHARTRSCAILLVIAFGARIVVADDEPKRPDAPQGFVWQTLEETNGAVLIPDGWHFRKLTTRDGLVYRVSKEKIEPGGKPFRTGLTINVVKDVVTKSKVKPAVYAAHYIKQYMKGAEVSEKPKIDMLGPLIRITCVVDKELPRVEKGTLFRVRVTALANDKTGTLYIMLFGSPKDEWEANYRIGKQLFNPMVLDTKI